MIATSAILGVQLIVGLAASRAAAQEIVPSYSPTNRPTPLLTDWLTDLPTDAASISTPNSTSNRTICARSSRARHKWRPINYLRHENIFGPVEKLVFAPAGTGELVPRARTASRRGAPKSNALTPVPSPAKPGEGRTVVRAERRLQTIVKQRLERFAVRALSAAILNPTGSRSGRCLTSGALCCRQSTPAQKMHFP